MLNRRHAALLVILSTVAVASAACGDDDPGQGSPNSAEAARISTASMMGRFTTSGFDITVSTQTFFEFCLNGTFLYQNATIVIGSDDDAFDIDDGWTFGAVQENRGMWSVSDGELVIEHPNEEDAKFSAPLEEVMRGEFIVGRALYEVNWGESQCERSAETPGGGGSGGGSGTGSGSGDG